MNHTQTVCATHKLPKYNTLMTPLIGVPSWIECQSPSQSEISEPYDIEVKILHCPDKVA